jgi:hypothetical protein
MKYNLEFFSQTVGTVKHDHQGSVAVLLLFIIYINDVPSTLNTFSEVIIFSDETSVKNSSKK